MSKGKLFFIGLLALVSTSLFAVDPISWTITQTFPATVLTAESHSAQYTFRNEMPFTLVNPLLISKTASSKEFTFNDQCSGKRLRTHEYCTVGITLIANSPGTKTVSLVIIEGYDNNQVPLPGLSVLSIINPFVTYTVGGSLSGLRDLASIDLQLNGAEILHLTADGSFVFLTPLLNSATYSVTILNQPLNQTCSVINGQGTIGINNVNNVIVSCPTYTLGGTLSGLDTANSKTVTVTDQISGQVLTLGSNGGFTFPTPLEQGQPYNVSVSVPPSNQDCVVANGTGTMGGANVTNITVSCTTPSYFLGGTLSGLAPTRAVTLKDTISGQELVRNSNGSFTFPIPIDKEQNYNVTVLIQPHNQNCYVANGAGTMGSANVTNISVTCYSYYTLGGTVSGLNTTNEQTVTLYESISNQLLLLATNGTYKFPNSIEQGQNYQVTVTTQPDNITTCTIMNGTGTMGNTNVVNVIVTCATNSYTLGGTINGLLPGNTITLNDGGTQNLTRTTNGSFQFANKINQNSPYNVTVTTQPTNQSCTVANGQGTMGAGPVTNVIVSCVTDNTILSVSVNELALSVDNLIEYGVPGIPSNPIPTSGQSRIITITNTGSKPAYNLNIAYPTFPSDTTATSNCPSTLAALATCQITISPGAEASSNGTDPCTNGTAPLPSTITISASNVTNNVSTDVYILGYGCIYQEGYIFAFDDTSPTTTSVRGKVVSNGVNLMKFWSANVDGTYDGGFPVHGIAENSTPANPDPDDGSGRPGCSGSVDGECNTNYITAHYTPPVPLDNYSAGYCKNLSNTYTDWYLPAICELSYNSNALTTCGTKFVPTTQNVRSFLRDTLSLNLGGSWSSTEYSLLPKDEAWLVFFFADGTSTVGRSVKSAQPGTLCVRTFND